MGGPGISLLNVVFMNLAFNLRERVPGVCGRESLRKVTTQLTGVNHAQKTALGHAR